MPDPLHAGLAIIAEALRYPAPGRLEQLRTAVATLPGGTARTELSSFVTAVSELSLGAWEELYTRTLDHNPASAPYLGYQVWGEQYQRGEFLVEMSRVITEADVDRDGELPDHLVPILRYLAIAEHPEARVLETLPQALEGMAAALSAADPANPFLHVLAAARAESATAANSGARTPTLGARRPS
jgi:nitrate reductase delta subunit